MRPLINKRGSFMQKYLFEIIFSAVLIILFLLATTQKVDSRDVKQQVIEKQIALLISSADPGMTFTINKYHVDSTINRIRVENGKVYADVDGLLSVKGYSYFSKYQIIVSENFDQFIIKVVQDV